MIRTEGAAPLWLISWGLSVVASLAGCSDREAQPGVASNGQSGAPNVMAGNAGSAPRGGASGQGGNAQSGGGMSDGESGGSAGSAGGGGAASTVCREESAPGPLTTRLPCALSLTGLYAPDMVTLAEGVHPYSPSFELWSDGAAKKRWVSLPEGTKIDTTDMDYWSFPPGTKLWKEFTRDGIRIETRLIEKQASGSWYTVSYLWREDQKDADAVPNGVENASGTEHDIPNSDQCLTCHSQLPDKALGFSAIQLSHQKSNPDDPLEWTLETLLADGLLTQSPSTGYVVPGTEIERKLFGYLHANCGHCHNPKGSQNSQTGLDLWLKVADLSGPVSAFSVYREIVGEDIAWLDGEHPDAPKRVAPGSLAESAVYQRFIKKAELWSMPPLGTEIVDPDGKKLLEDWIAGLK